MERVITWREIDQHCELLAKKVVRDKINPTCIVSIGRGGLIPAAIVANLLNVKQVFNFGVSSYSDSHQRQAIKMYQRVFFDPPRPESVLIIDDLVDTGEAMKFVYSKIDLEVTERTKIYTAVLYKKTQSQFMPEFFVEAVSHDTWLVFPWEKPRVS